MSTKQLYTILGVPETASPLEIKNAYKQLAAKWHPDKCKDETKLTMYNDKFKEIGQAYEILSNPEKRQIYDQVGDNSNNNIEDVIRQQEEMKNMRGMFGGQGFGFDPRNMFGQGGSNGQGIQIQFNPNIMFNIKLTLEDIYTGTEIIYQLKRQVIHIIGGKPTQTNENESITIKIPKGTRAGENIVIDGRGNKLIQDNVVKKQGSVICVVEEIPHVKFQRSQAQPLHLLLKHTISIFQALLGDFNITLTGIDGNKFNVSIEHTVITPETVISIVDKGMVSVNGKKGNIYVTFNIEYPAQLSSEQRTALELMTNYVKTTKKSHIVTKQLTMGELQQLINTPDRNEQEEESQFGQMFGQGHEQGRRGNPNVHVQQCAQQ